MDMTKKVPYHLLNIQFCFPMALKMPYVTNKATSAYLRKATKRDVIPGFHPRPIHLIL